MTISGVALLAICALLGGLLGDLLGVALGVKANVGGVGIAMMFLIAARLWLVRHGILSHGLKTGVGFWGSFYIPIVVAMAAQATRLESRLSGGRNRAAQRCTRRRPGGHRRVGGARGAGRVLVARND